MLQSQPDEHVGGDEEHQDETPGVGLLSLGKLLWFSVGVADAAHGGRRDGGYD